MSYFGRFMGWFVLYSILYFLSLDIMGIPPGKESEAYQKILNWGVLFAISIPLWLITWRKFHSTFGPKKPANLAGGAVSYSFSIRKPVLHYYLTVLKPFLLVMGANGIISLSHHEDGWKTFYIVNFIVLYLYALPMLVIKIRKYSKMLKMRLVVDTEKLSLQKASHPVAEIKIADIESIAIEKASGGMLIKGANHKIYIGGIDTKASPFYVSGSKEILNKMQMTANGSIREVTSLNEELKKQAFKPLI